MHQEKKWATWNLVTKRSHSKVYEELLRANTGKVLMGVNGPIKPFRLKSILKGENSLLSLGEGLSSFIFEILQKQKARNVQPTAFAVDMVYADTAAFTDDFILFEDEQRRIEEFQQEFPGQYQGAYFQNMKFPKSQGKENKFDEIVSGNSLTYLLARLDRRSALQTREVRAQDKALLENILSHLKRGGVLRAWPLFPGSPKKLPWPTRQAYVRDLLNELLAEGYISNHNYIVNERPEQEFLILVR